MPSKEALHSPLSFLSLCARPTVVELSIAYGDILSRESHTDSHRSLVVNVECLLVMNDVSILERNLLHLSILFALLVNDLTLNRLELAVKHSLDSRSVISRLDSYTDTTARDA